MAYKFSDHRADIRMQIENKDLQGLFRDALSGMSVLIKEKHKFSPVTKRQIRLEAPDRTVLLIDFLNEALTLGQINKVLYFDFEVHEISETRLFATLFGVKIAKFDTDIKAVSFHEAEIVHKNKKYQSTIIFDI